jgi:hypothetical protein
VATTFNELQRMVAGVQPTEVVDPEVRQRLARLAHGACRVARDHWKELADQLNATRPPSLARYLIGSRHPLEGLRCCRFRVQHVSRTDHEGMEYFDKVTLAWHAANDERMRIEQGFAGDAEQVRAALRFAGIDWDETPIRRSDTGRQLATVFEFTGDVSASVQLTPLPASGHVQLAFVNLDQLERIEAKLPATSLRLSRFDAIAHWIVGEPHHALDHAVEIKRFAP